MKQINDDDEGDAPCTLFYSFMETLRSDELHLVASQVFTDLIYFASFMHSVSKICGLHQDATDFHCMARTPQRPTQMQGQWLKSVKIPVVKGW